MKYHDTTWQVLLKCRTCYPQIFLESIAVAAHRLCEHLLQQHKWSRLQQLLPAVASHHSPRDCRWHFLSSAVSCYGTYASQPPCRHSQGWDAFGAAPHHVPVDTSSPVAVDGLDRNQVDQLFQQADWDRNSRQAFALQCHCPAWRQNAN